jgi:hypothetical protein
LAEVEKLPDAYVAAVRANAQARHARQALNETPGPHEAWRRALSEVNLFRVEITCETAKPAKDLFRPVGQVLRELLIARATREEMESILRVMDRTLVPALLGLPVIHRTGWHALLSSTAGLQGASGLSSRTLLLAAMLPHASVQELIVGNGGLLFHAPALALLWLGLLGQHLRSGYDALIDNVDLMMVGLTLPVTLQQLQDADDATVNALGRAFVSGITFALERKDETRTVHNDYLAHFVHWMELARSAGICDPEAIIARCFAAAPEALPAEAPALVLQRSPGASLGTHFLRELDCDRAAATDADGEGAWGLFSGHPRWIAYLKRATLQENARPTYAFLRELTRVEAPNAEELENTRSTLEALEHRLPVALRPALVAQTRAALNGGDDATLRRLGAEWRKCFDPDGTQGYGAPPVHPWRVLANALADHLEETPA